MERRSDERIDIELSCRLKSLRDGGFIARASTVNLSRNGALVLAPEEHLRIARTGAQVELEILLPTDGSFPQRCLSCDAEVVRVKYKLLALKFYQVRFREPFRTGTDVADRAVKQEWLT